MHVTRPYYAAEGRCSDGPPLRKPLRELQRIRCLSEMHKHISTQSHSTRDGKDENQPHPYDSSHPFMKRRTSCFVAGLRTPYGSTARARMAIHECWSSDRWRASTVPFGPRCFVRSEKSTVDTVTPSAIANKNAWSYYDLHFTHHMDARSIIDKGYWRGILRSGGGATRRHGAWCVGNWELGLHLRVSQ
jgi:hypothetical protein